jgi:hypothetical protein
MGNGVAQGYNRARGRAADEKPHDHGPPLPIVAPRHQQPLRLLRTGGYTGTKLCVAGGRVRHGVWRPPRRERPRCGATTRTGGRCRAPVVWKAAERRPRARCRLHGGLSTGPKTPAAERPIR